MPSVRIGGESFQLRTNTSSATVVTDGVHKTIYTIPDKNVEVIQSVSIVKDKYEIKYTITNTGSDKNSIGFQFHLDTMLGNDDSAPFIVDGSKVTKQTVYSGDDIPIGFTVYNQDTGTLSNADFQAGGIIKGEGIIENPSQLAIGNYSLVDDWDFNSNTGAVGDSGYSLWWDQREINSGGSFTINTFYGQSVPPTIQDPTKSSGDGPFDLLLQVGANTNKQFRVQLSDARAINLGIDQLNVLSNTEANQALARIDKAIQLVSTERTKYGAYQNALEHINNNVTNYKVNLTASESRIRDLDMPKEITKLTNNQVILQSAQAMLAQANQSSQSILEFLK
ncbi:hypothetical protein H7992_18815 [Sporosarcina sp. resist]|uniref:flagellin n=1 Tax=Sporosarcina sp. resist TaxID=2762563 RepID=UPI00164EA28B|nr:hypothetical protein H7992_18815 [Sporosarcina sp. resist]